mmetsp:Transcript_56240/g.161415  ORF Transcript_56240/g.161415 Transcript_56240/m.161415 type:complete len:238 (-) Transcript_56240:498-1211(-)
MGGLAFPFIHVCPGDTKLDGSALFQQLHQRDVVTERDARQLCVDVLHFFEASELGLARPLLQPEVLNHSKVNGCRVAQHHRSCQKVVKPHILGVLRDGLIDGCTQQEHDEHRHDGESGTGRHSRRVNEKLDVAHEQEKTTMENDLAQKILGLALDVPCQIHVVPIRRNQDSARDHDPGLQHGWELPGFALQLGGLQPDARHSSADDPALWDDAHVVNVLRVARDNDVGLVLVVRQPG